MWTHSPAHYRCPFCALLAGAESERNRHSDIVSRDDATAALVAPKSWATNPGHALVVPVEHFENLYDVPDDVLARVYATAKRVALAMKDAYGCEGTSTRQHNEPGGGQDVWHLHVHVFPRYAGDRLYENNGRTRWATPEERSRYAEKLRPYLRPNM